MKLQITICIAQRVNDDVVLLKSIEHITTATTTKQWLFLCTPSSYYLHLELKLYNEIHCSIETNYNLL